MIRIRRSRDVLGAFGKHIIQHAEQLEGDPLAIEHKVGVIAAIRAGELRGLRRCVRITRARTQCGHLWSKNLSGKEQRQIGDAARWPQR